MIELICVLLLLAPSSQAADFAIRDGDTVVLLGDSITAEGTWGKFVENYTLLRFPARKVKFINAGLGGDTAEGGLERLRRDVLDRGATVVIVAYGINDIGWGAKADEEHRQKYLDSIGGIVEKCKAKNVRVFICSAAVTASDPDKSEDDFLQKMCDEGMAISRSLGEGAIDIEREMRKIQREIKTADAQVKDEKDKTTLHAADRIHLNDLGEMAMGFAVVKGLGAPREVSSLTIDAADSRVKASAGCSVDHVQASAERVEFDRLDEALPYNSGLFGALKFRFIHVPDEINRYMLCIENLRPGRYRIVVDGRGLGSSMSEEFAEGINIASSTANNWVPGGPWEAQGWSLNALTDARWQLFMSGKFADAYMPKNDLNGDRARINEEIEMLQRLTARPRKYHFVVEPGK